MTEDNTTDVWDQPITTARGKEIKTDEGPLTVGDVAIQALEMLRKDETGKVKVKRGLTAIKIAQGHKLTSEEQALMFKDVDEFFSPPIVVSVRSAVEPESLK